MCISTYTVLLKMNEKDVSALWHCYARHQTLRGEKKMNIEQAKRIPLEAVMRAYGHEVASRNRHDLWYRSPFRDESEPSFKIHEGRNVWYDHGEGQGGDIIALVKRLENSESVSHCLRVLDRMDGGQGRVNRPRFSPAKDEEAQSPFDVERVAPLTNRALLGYLWGRGIPKTIAQRYLQEMHYRYDGKRFFALAFPNDAGGFEMRNPYFQGVHGRKATSTILPTLRIESEPPAPAVFEGFSDFLSALVHYGVEQSQQPVIILNSATMRDQAIEVVQAMSAKKAYLYFDHDKTGRELTAYVTGQLSGVEALDKSSLYDGYKDFNEFLISQRQQGRAA